MSLRIPARIMARSACRAFAEMFQCVYTLRGDVRHIITVHRIDAKRSQAMAKSVRTTVTPEMHQDIIRSVDWDRVSRMTDEAIAEDIARDPDAMPFTDADGVALRVQLIRKRLSLSQAQFAAQFHIPLATLKDWEQGRRQPEAAAWAYLRVIEGEPAAVRRALKAA